MKKNILTITALFFFSLTTFSQGGAQNIIFTAKANATNGLDIYAKNITGSTISGILGSSLLTLSIALPSSISPQPTVSISSPISGQTFDNQIHDNATINSTAYDVYTYNGLGSTASINFPSNTEVLIATYSFTNSPVVTSNVLLVMLPGGGTSTFDYCYIAPGGTDETDYSNPFYSDIPSDPLLHNGNGLNDFTLNSLSYLGVANVSLPIKFTGFSAVKKNDDALLTWGVANEGPSTDHYEVERSFNGADFDFVASVAVKGGNLSSNTYSFTDDNISTLKSSGVIYYRIMQVDKTGSNIYTEIKSLSLGNSALTITAYPNPVKSFVALTINLPEASSVAIHVSDASGRMVREIQMSGAKGININKIDMSSFASGSYMLKVNTGTETTTLPIVKE